MAEFNGGDIEVAAGAALLAKALSETISYAEGEMENRIKEQQLYLFATRTSAQKMAVDQVGLWLSSLAYVLIETLRRVGLAGSALARARCDTIRLKLFKIGALMRPLGAPPQRRHGQQPPLPARLRPRLTRSTPPIRPPRDRQEEVSPHTDLSERKYSISTPAGLATPQIALLPAPIVEQEKRSLQKNPQLPPS